MERRTEDPRAGRRLRPGLLVPEERQPPARATGDEAVRRAISDAHEASWQAALAYLEAEACVVRRGRGGAIREHGDGFVAAAFRHRTSRAQDPHLHTHVIVANLARSPDGEVARPRRRGDPSHLPPCGRLPLRGPPAPRAVALARRALDRAGEGHGRDRGRADAGAPRLLERVASRSSSTCSTKGTSGFAASRVAALATRERKERDRPLRPARDVARPRIGDGPRSQGAPRPPRPRDGARAELPAITADDLTEHQTTIAAPEIVRAVAGAAREGASMEAVLAGVEQIIRDHEVTLVESDTTPGRPARFTARSLLDLECDALRIGLAGREAGAPQAAAAHVLSALADAPVSLSAEQRSSSPQRRCRRIGSSAWSASPAQARRRRFGLWAMPWSALASRCSEPRRVAELRMSSAKQPRIRQGRSTPC